VSGDTALVRVEKLCHFFGESESRRQVLFDNTIALEAGEIAILTGPSGSGKTTLLTLIGALRSVQDGSIRVLGHELRGLDVKSLVLVRRNIGFIFQLHNLFEALSAFENVMMAIELSPGIRRREMEKRSKEILERVGLGARLHLKPEALSGGERQRVSIARALVNGPRLILADEPTAALDKESGKGVIELFQELCREQKCGVLIVTHDARVLAAADRIVNMVDGRIVSDAYVREEVRICEFLSNCPAFAALSPIVLSDITEKMSRERVQAGQTIARAGEASDKFYLVRSGSLKVYREDSEGRTIATTLKEGEFFGEAALMTAEPTDATIVADSNTELYVLSRPDFQAAIEATASFNEQILRALFQRQ
jgi:putative ABC transport system ATP-binding protein